MGDQSYMSVICNLYIVSIHQLNANGKFVSLQGQRRAANDRGHKGETSGDESVLEMQGLYLLFSTPPSHESSLPLKGPMTICKAAAFNLRVKCTEPGKLVCLESL